MTTSPLARALHRGGAVLLILAGVHCGSSSTSPPANQPQAAVIGELTSALHGRLAARVRLKPYAGGRNAPIVLQGSAVSSLGEKEQQGIKRTYDAGWSIVVLDASLESVRAVEDLVDPSPTRLRIEPVAAAAGAAQATASCPGSSGAQAVPHLLAHVVRREPDGHHPLFLVDPQGVTGYESALDSAVAILTDALGMPTSSRTLPVTTSDAPYDLTNNPVGTGTIAIPQANEGAFNTTLMAYAVHECATGLDHYVVTSMADWTPGSTYLSAQGDDIISPPLDMGPQSVRAWTNEYIKACGAEKEDDIPPAYQNLPTDLSGGKDNTACEFVDYPLSYAVQMSPPANGTILQIDASPEATQGFSTSYSSGFSFSIDGNIGYYGAGAIAGDAGATWDSETSTTVPSMLIEAGNVGNQGAQWTFDYCTTQKDNVCGSQSIQPYDPTHTCQNALGPPQNGQTLDGKFSNAGQMVHWTAACNTRTGSTFDVAVSFTANLASTQILVWGSDSAGFGLTGGTCNTINEPFSGWCACDVDTTANPVSGTFTFKIPYPPDASASTCDVPCTESIPPSKNNPGCTCICPNSEGCGPL